jgi:AcrR family transcriptional regulator
MSQACGQHPFVLHSRETSTTTDPAVHRITWRGLTSAAVAARAQVGTRTVYRHFPTERDLHGAILARLQDDAGGAAYEQLTLGDLARVTARMHQALSSFAVARWTDDVPLQPALAEVELNRRHALVRAVAEAAGDWPPADREMAAAILDVLWNIPAYQRLRTAWNLPGAAATTAITWAISILADASRSGRAPTADSNRPRPGKRG